MTQYMIKKWRTVHLGRVHSPDALVLHYRQALENTTVVSIAICDSLQQEDEQFGGCLKFVQYCFTSEVD